MKNATGICENIRIALAIAIMVEKQLDMIVVVNSFGVISGSQVYLAGRDPAKVVPKPNKIGGKKGAPTL